MLRTAMLLFMLLFVFSFTARCEDAKDKDGIEGTWLPTSAEIAGKMLPDDIRKAIKLVVKGDKYTVSAGKGADEGTVKLNAKAKPKELDIVGTEGPNKGK